MSDAETQLSEPRRDDTAYVQDFIDKGLRIPSGEYLCPGGVTFPHDYIDRAQAAGREPDVPPDFYAMGDPGSVVICSGAGGKVWLGVVRRAETPGREEPVVICRDDIAIQMPHPASLVLNDVAYQVGGTGGGYIRD
jgi:hypothetical protein